MDEHNAHRGLQLLVGELLYKNQLLREAVASKDRTVDLIIDHLMTATASGLPLRCWRPTRFGARRSQIARSRLR